MKKTLAVTAALLTICTAALAAPGGPPPGPFNSQRVHVNPSHRMHTPTGNRVRMTPQYGAAAPIGGRMSSVPGPAYGGSRTAHIGPGHRQAPVYVRPYAPPRYYRPAPLPPPPHWRHAGYYSGHYWRPYGYGSVWYGAPIGYYGYPWYGYYGGYYVRPGVHISVRL
ncbi:MAG: hypothetical protein IJV12_01240 [Acidaminococcaceae bacterium]|nr:hypothetical protein [Acidaminococcaceae bacterium]